MIDMNRLYSRIIILVTVCSLFVSTVQASLKQDLKRIFYDEIPHAAWSVLIEEEKTGKTLFSRNPKRCLIPASNMKVLVCSAALLRLGPDYTYQTPIFTTGKQTGKTLEGSLIVFGSGDPSIGGRFYGDDMTFIFRQWAAKLKQNGITSIDGNIIGVDDVFDENRLGLNWNPNDYIEWYAAEVSALSFNDACIDLIVQGASKSGVKATVTMNPPTRYLKLVPSVRTVNTRRRNNGIRIQRGSDSRSVEITGRTRTRKTTTHYATIPNPTLYCATVLKETLQSEGIKIKGTAKDGDDVKLPGRETWKRLHIHHSPPLADLISVCMKNSQNLYAEHLIKTLGWVEYGKGSWETGTLAVKDILFQHGCNIDSLYIADGSGLSRENRVNAAAVANVLRVMRQSKHARIFNDVLPLAGVDGTLKLRMRNTAATGTVSAKTGTLNGTRALSGFIRAKSGKTYIFSMIGNATRQAVLLNPLMDEACALIAAKG